MKSDGSVVAWGDNYDGQTNVPVTAKSGVLAMEGGHEHTLALKSDGSVVSWGSLSQATVPVSVLPAFAIATGGFFTVAVGRDPVPSLTLLRNADQTLSLSWTGVGRLEQSDGLTAPNWQPAASHANPQTLSTTSPMKFHRVKVE